MIAVEKNSSSPECLDDRASLARNTGPKLRTFFRDRPGDRRSLHLSFLVHNNSGIVLEIDHGSVLSPPAFSLSNNHAKHNFLSKFWLSFLHTANNHIPNRGRWKSIQSSLVSLDRDNEKVLGSRVIATVNHSTGGQTQTN